MSYVAHEVHERGMNKLGVHVIDFGGRDVNGTTRPLFPGADRYVSVDIVEGRGVDIVCNAAELDLRDRFHVVLSTELLEHTPQGAEIVANAFKHLHPGGWFVATMAGPGRKPHSADGADKLRPGEHYCNVTREMLDGWLQAAGFEWWSIDQTDIDLRCVARKAEVTDG
jgi:predicted SAM-dependent methyltransferase